MRHAPELERLASACIFPGFEGPAAPDWLRRRLAEGLGGVVLYAWNPLAVLETAGSGHVLSLIHI